MLIMNILKYAKVTEAEFHMRLLGNFIVPNHRIYYEANNYILSFVFTAVV